MIEQQLQEDLVKELDLDEGVRLKPYRDTVGKLTIGVGRNLDDVGISLEEANYLLANDIARHAADLDAHLPWWRDLDEARQLVLLDLCFNMGIGKLLGFHNTLAAVQSGDYENAGDQLIDSVWYREVGQRGPRLVNIMKTGVIA